MAVALRGLLLEDKPQGAEMLLRKMLQGGIDPV